jgi:hypothetical protein
VYCVCVPLLLSILLKNLHAFFHLTSLELTFGITARFLLQGAPFLLRVCLVLMGQVYLWSVINLVLEGALQW